MAPLYEPLDHDQIRLITLEDDSGLQCSLRSYSRNETPPYIALSYTWSKEGIADDSPRPSIQLNGEIFPVQHNLHDALNYLAVSVREKECLLWVDAICIDQLNLAERAAQVKIMKLIYECADEVHAWLGLPTDEARAIEAADLMRRVHDDILAKYRDSSITQAEYFETASTVDHFAFPLPARHEVCNAWAGIAEIFARPYWQRTWIQQEATTPVTTVFHHGRAKFSTLHLARILALSARFSSLPASRGIESLRGVTESKTVVNLVMSRLIREANITRRLLEVLVESRMTYCTDPRDKVYSAIGHASDIFLDGEFEVDYNKNVKEVYVDTAQRILATGRSRFWEILGHVFTPIPDFGNEYMQKFTDPSLPSWLPDWRQRIVVTNIAGQKADTSPVYEPWPGSEVDAHIEGDKLKGTGIVALSLEIEHLTNFWRYTDPVLVMEQVALWFQDISATNFLSMERLIPGFFQTLVGDRTLVSGLESDGRWLLPFRRGHHVNPQDILSSGVEVTQFCASRKMGIVSGGSLGLFPLAARNGDKIAAFAGSGALHVVRPAGTEEGVYSFVGDCYIDGMMDGLLVGTEISLGNEARLITLI